MKNPYLPPITLGDGRDFERFVLGEPAVESSLTTGANFNQSIREALRDCIGGGSFPDTIIGDTLYYHVRKYLKSFGVPFSSVLFLCTSNTTIDAVHQSDATFVVMTQCGRGLVATIDVAYMARWFDYAALSMGDVDYLSFQNMLYHQKMWSKKQRNKIKQKKIDIKHRPKGRPKNHFILTMNDLYRRGLKRLGRVIAQSIKDQYMKNVAQQSH